MKLRGIALLTVTVFALHEAFLSEGFVTCTNGKNINREGTVQCNVLVNESVCLICSIYHNTSNIGWFFGNPPSRLVRDRLNLDSTHAGGLEVNECHSANYSLKLLTPTVNQNGRSYFCKHQNDVITNFTLKVLAKPTLSIVSDGILKSSLLITEEDSTETLNCIANGGTTPITLIWKINNAEIKRQTFINENDNRLQQNLSLTFVPSIDVKNITCACEGTSIKTVSSSLKVIISKKGVPPEECRGDKGKLYLYSSKTFSSNILPTNDGSTEFFTCTVNGVLPPVSLTWLKDNLEEKTKAFHKKENETNLCSTYSSTFSFTVDKPVTNITCMSNGSFVAMEHIFVQIRQGGDELLKWSCFATASALLVSLLLAFGLVFFRNKGRRMQHSFDRTTSQDCNVYNLDHNGTEVLGNVQAIDDVPDAKTSLVSRIKINGQFEYWHATYSKVNAGTEKCFGKSLSGESTFSEASSFKDLAQRLRSLLENEYVVHVLHIDVDNVPYTIFYEILEFGTLRDFVVTQFQQSTCSKETEEARLEIQVNQLRTFAYNIAQAMKFISGQNFCHPVLRMKKVLLTRECNCKLYDIYPDDMAMTKIRRVMEKDNPPIRWISPESIFLNMYQSSSDIWSFGVLLWELFSLGDIPLPRMSNKQVEEQIRKGFALQQPPNCPDRIYDLMLSTWHSTAEERPTFDVMVHVLEGELSTLDKHQQPDRHVYFTLEQELPSY